MFHALASETIVDGQIELGLGLHNEPGVRRVPLNSPEWLISEMVRVIRGSGGGWRGSDIYIGTSIPMRKTSLCRC